MYSFWGDVFSEMCKYWFRVSFAETLQDHFASPPCSKTQFDRIASDRIAVIIWCIWYTNVLYFCVGLFYKDANISRFPNMYCIWFVYNIYIFVCLSFVMNIFSIFRCSRYNKIFARELCGMTTIFPFSIASSASAKALCIYCIKTYLSCVGFIVEPNWEFESRSHISHEHFPFSSLN